MSLRGLVRLARRGANLKVRDRTLRRRHRRVRRLGRSGTACRTQVRSRPESPKRRRDNFNCTRRFEDNITGIDELHNLAPLELQRLIQSMANLRVETKPEEADDDASRPLSARASIWGCTVQYVNERVVSSQRG